MLLFSILIKLLNAEEKRAKEKHSKRLVLITNGLFFNAFLRKRDRANLNNFNDQYISDNYSYWFLAELSKDHCTCLAHFLDCIFQISL